MQQPDTNDTDPEFNTRVLARERDGERYIERILEEVYSHNWRNSLFVILFMAGPITYLGLQVGYYVGYGKFAPWNIFMYFACFTMVVMGLEIGLRLIGGLMNKQKQKNTERQVKTVLGGVFSLISVLRNQRIAREEPELRKYDAALEVLKNAHAEVRAIETAVRTLTDDENIAKIAADIEVYRRAGMNIYVGDIVKQHENEILSACEKLREIRGDVADWLSYRLSGLAPSMRDGLERSDGFIERILAWIDNDDSNADLLRPRDFEELATFAFELMVGREIPLLWIEFQGNKKLNDAAAELNNARNRYRVALGARFSRIKALSRLFALDDKLDELELRDSSVLLSRVHDEMDIRAAQIKKLKAAKTKHTAEIRSLRAELRTAVDLYRELLLSEKRVKLRQDIMRKALNTWDKLSAKHDIDFGHDKKNGRYLTVVRRMIRLTSLEKARFSEFLYPYFEEESDPARWSEEHLEKALIAIVEILDELVFLGYAERQRAIESSPAANLGWVEAGFSSVAKANYGTAAIEEVRNDLSRAAERMFRVLLSQYSVEVNSDMIRFFEEQYNARPHVLEAIMETHDPGSSMPALAPMEKLLVKPKLKSSWLDAL
jgi:uncharacterized protein YhhL (DUF1145 family)